MSSIKNTQSEGWILIPFWGNQNLFASLYFSTQRIRSFFNNVVCKFYKTKDSMIVWLWLRSYDSKRCRLANNYSVTNRTCHNWS